MSDVQRNVSITRGGSPLTDKEIALSLVQLWHERGGVKQKDEILAFYEEALKKVREV